MAVDPIDDTRDPKTHPKILENQNPDFFSSIYDSGKVFYYRSRYQRAFKNVTTCVTNIRLVVIKLSWGRFH